MPTKLTRWLRCSKISTIVARCRRSSTSISEAAILCPASSSGARSWPTERGLKWTNPDASSQLKWNLAQSALISSLSKRIRIVRSPGSTPTDRSSYRWPSRPKSTSSSPMCSRRPSFASSTTAPRPQTPRSCRGRSYPRSCSRPPWCASVHRKSSYCSKKTRRSPSLSQTRKSKSTRSSPPIPSAATSSPRKLSRRRLRRLPLKSQLRRSRLLVSVSLSCRPTQLKSWRLRRRTVSRTSSTT